MRVLYHIPDPSGLGADRWIYEGWRDAFQSAGHDVTPWTRFVSPRETVADVRPDIVMTAANLLDERAVEALVTARHAGGRVFVLVDGSNAQRPGILRAIEAGIVDVCFGEREPDSMMAFEEETGIAYHLVPNACNPRLHRPVAPVAKYSYDIVYLGADLPKKRRMVEDVLLPLRRRYRVGIFGPGWTLKDGALAVLQKSARTVGWSAAATTIGRARITVPDDDEAALYSSARISLNFHEREKDGSQPHHIVNQRAFKIPACGGFQVSDHVPALRNYFTEDEVVTATTPDEWFRTIDHYLKNPDERERIRRNGTARALRDHTYDERLKLLFKIGGFG